MLGINSNPTITINGIPIKPGTRITIDLPAGHLYTHTPINVPVQVINGKKPGPRLFISAAIHGDELNGVEIIRRILKLSVLKQVRGTLITVPIVNVQGFINHTRYLPDRRDLNRSFPGSNKGSLAARLAHLFMREIVSNCTHGIDLHTGAIHRGNLPQIRANLDDAETERLARAFGVPVLLNSTLRDGSLREAAAEMGIPMLLYEAGEALRFDELSIRAGVRGIINVMRTLEMIPPTRSKSSKTKEPVVARASTWIRAPIGGILRIVTQLGTRIKKSGLMGVISDPFGEREIPVLSPCDGIIIGSIHVPLVNEGDALFHVAKFHAVKEAVTVVEEFHEHYDLSPEETPESDTPTN